MLSIYLRPRIPRKWSFRSDNLLSARQLQIMEDFHSGMRQSGPHPVELDIERQDGIVSVSEEDLFRYTRYRWLFNEQQELQKRYVKFSLRQLVKAAVDVSDGARYCTKILKCSEGLHNKAFILTMNNGSEVFAKIPNPNAGPSRFTTASEVATRELLHDVYRIPVPRALAWSSDAANNPVEAEYIIEEKAPGVRLGSVWNQWPRERKLQIVKQVAVIENTLTAITFPKHGCIYFKDDLRSLTGYAEDIDINTATSHSFERFSIGPLVSQELWSGARKDMDLDRGPWRNSSDYTQALGRNEIAWIKSHAKPRMNYYRSIQNQELPNDGLSLLQQYMAVASYLVPLSDNPAATSNVLWHPDLHLDNVFVDLDTHEITRIVDWQSACVAPLFYQSNVPRMFRHTGPVREGWIIPERPEDYDSLSENEQKKIDDDLENEIIHKYYESQVYKLAPRHWAVLQQKSVPAIRKPAWLVSGVWENKDLFFLRDSLISLVNQWEKLFPDGQQPCPIMFGEKDIELHAKEEENINGVGHILAMFQDQAVLPVDGMVNPTDYEIAKENCIKFKKIFLGLAQDESERRLFEKLWPYQEPAE